MSTQHKKVNAEKKVKFKKMIGSATNITTNKSSLLHLSFHLQALMHEHKGLVFSPFRLVELLFNLVGPYASTFQILGILSAEIAKVMIDLVPLL